MFHVSPNHSINLQYKPTSGAANMHKIKTQIFFFWGWFTCSGLGLSYWVPNEPCQEVPGMTKICTWFHEWGWPWPLRQTKYQHWARKYTFPVEGRGKQNILWESKTFWVQKYENQKYIVYRSGDITWSVGEQLKNLKNQFQWKIKHALETFILCLLLKLLNFFI